MTLLRRRLLHFAILNTAAHQALNQIAEMAQEELDRRRPAEEEVEALGDAAVLFAFEGRRAILDLLCEEARPLGAYDMIEKLAAKGGKRSSSLSLSPVVL